MKAPMPVEVTPPMRFGAFVLVIATLISSETVGSSLTESSSTIGESLTESSQTIGGSLEKSSENFGMGLTNIGMGLRSIGVGISALGLFLMAGTIYAANKSDHR